MEIEGFGTLVNPDEMEWTEVPGGNSVKVLRVSEESGSYTALFKAAKGTVNPPHIHLGPADFSVLSGVTAYRGGAPRARDRAHEPHGAQPAATMFGRKRPIGIGPALALSAPPAVGENWQSPSTELEERVSVWGPTAG